MARLFVADDGRHFPGRGLEKALFIWIIPQLVVPLPPKTNYLEDMSNENRKQEGLQALGKDVVISTDYNPSVLETFENMHPENDYWVKFNCPEFTTLCPITGQPDFAEIRIMYIPDVRMVESKSLKLYLFSFRNHGDFHEDCINTIMKDLIHVMDPKYIEVIGLFVPRGGISIHPYANYGRPGTKYEQLAEARFANHSL